MWNKVKKVNLPYLVLSVFMAALLWFYVDVTVKPDTRVVLRNLEVVFQGEEELMKEGLMVSDHLPRTVTLTVTGSRTLVSQLNRSNVTIEADLASQVHSAGRTELDYVIRFPNGVSLSNVKVKRSVATVEAEIVKHSVKTIRVEAMFTGQVADGYLGSGEDFFVAPSEITIQGEDSLVRMVDHAVAELSEKNLSSTWEGFLPVKLVTAQGEEINSTELEVSTQEVRGTFPISCYKDVRLTVELLPGGGADAGYVTDFVLTPSMIRVCGTEEELKGLNTIVLGQIDLGRVVTSYKDTFEIQLPAGVTSKEDRKEAQVSFSVSEDLTTKVVTVSDIGVKNVPKGCTAQVAHESIEVEIRGPKESMKLLRKEYVEVVADLSEVPAGTVGRVEVPAIISVRGMSDVAAMGSYVIAVDLS